MSVFVAEGSTKVSLNSSRPLRRLPGAGTYIDESPALTAVLQARPGAIVQGMSQILLECKVISL